MNAMAAIDQVMEYVTARRNRAISILASLETVRNQLRELDDKPAEKPAPAQKARVQRSMMKGPNAKILTHETIIDLAVGAIRKGGPQTLQGVTKAVRKAYPAVVGGIGKALRQEAKKTGGRVARNQHGRWIETAEIRRVDDKRTPDEVAAAFAKARANADRQTEAA